MIKMKKIIGDKNFLIILIVSVLVLVSMTIGVVFLTHNNAKEFYSAGYIIDSSTTKSSKYYFDDETVYKENVFSEYVFKDVDNRKVKTKKDNFIHYLDDSLSFMKNGVILDLDNFNENLVPYYNITDESIIKYNNGGYYVETADKTLVFGNFLGRITDDKYIVVGKDVKVKLSGSDNAVSGNYFELLFVENGIVKVENQEGSYQTLTEGTIIYIGDNIEINLGDGTVSYGGETKLSLNELTIDGNENIDINPNGKPSDSDKNEGNGQGGSAGTAGNGEDNLNIFESGNGNGETTILKKEVSVNLIEAETDVNSIKARFQVIDTAGAIKGNLLLTLVDTTNGKTVYTKILPNVSEEQLVIVNSLSSSTNYLMTITDEDNRSGVQYFQKNFKTASLDLKLIREMVTETSLSYVVDFGISDEIKAVDVTLYDSKNKVINSYKVENGGNNRVTFDGLTHNTTYKVVVNNALIDNVWYDDAYRSETNDITLKNKPVLGHVSTKTNKVANSYTLILDGITDEDESAVKYTYQIFSEDDLVVDKMATAKPVYSFTRDTLKEEVLNLAEAKLQNNKNYAFKVSVQYYDNYRYNEVETEISNYFQVSGVPTITFEPSNIDFDRIAGTVVINDDTCMVPFEGRACNDDVNNFEIRYYVGSSRVRYDVKDIVVDATKQTLSFDLQGLSENTFYIFEVFANIDKHDVVGTQEGQFLGGFYVSTANTASLIMQNWKRTDDYSYNRPISLSTEMVPSSAEENPIDKLATITINIYNGDVHDRLSSVSPIASKTIIENIKQQFDGKPFKITSDMFGIADLEALKELSNGNLSTAYTVEFTDAYDETGTNKFNIMNNVYVYEMPLILVLEDKVSSPSITVEEITNLQAKSGEYNDYGIMYNADYDNEIVVGYKASAVNFDRSRIESYAGSDTVTSINFYVDDANGKRIDEKAIDLTDGDERTVYFPLKAGTEYDVTDNDMRRGNTYVFSCDATVVSASGSGEEITFPRVKPTSDDIVATKQAPKIKFYVDSSTSDTVTYKYQLLDYDNALYKEEDKYYFHYSVDGEDYLAQIDKSDSFETFTLNNLSNGSIYGISYYLATVKNDDPYLVKLGDYFFDGTYDSDDYNLGYSIIYGEFQNMLKVILPNDDFLNRVSAYLLTLDAGDDKYEIVISDLDTCGEDKCIIIDYQQIARLKNKNIKVSLEAFYDTGYMGFSQKNRLGDYFLNKELVSSKDASKVGYVYQRTSSDGPGEYFYVSNNNNFVSAGKSPKGILAMEIVSTNAQKGFWELSTSNLVNIQQKMFVPFGQIIRRNETMTTGTGSLTISGNGTVNPKVLDRVSIQTEDDDFKFTSIIPKVSASVDGLINGAVMHIDLNVDEETLKSDYVATDGLYKFYIDIYEKKVCDPTELEDGSCSEDMVLIKTVETDYNSLSEVTFAGLNPASTYYYRISADMNIKGEKQKTALFKRDGNNDKYIEFESQFNTLNKDGIFNDVDYDYESVTDEERYSNRYLNIISHLKNNVNFDIKYQVYGNDDELEFESTVLNNTFTKLNSFYSAKYTHDISGNDFMFGAMYHRLVITAVTKGVNEETKELELFNDYLIDNSADMRLKELSLPSITLVQNPGITESGTYNITYTITVKDTDKVINDGIYYIELQNSAYSNACGDNPEDCMVTVNIKEKTCKFGNGKEIGCTIVATNKDRQVVNVTFDNLKPDTNYVIYVYANTYRNNRSLTEKEGLVYARKSQYTKSALGFSLGAVTPTATSRTKLVITFAGAAYLSEGSENLGIVGLDYDVTIQGGEKVASGHLGRTDATDSASNKLVFKQDKDGYPTIEIPIDSGKELGLNNYIIITYYYLDAEGRLTKLKFGESTSYQYTVKNEMY